MMKIRTIPSRLLFCSFFLLPCTLSAQQVLSPTQPDASTANPGNLVLLPQSKKSPAAPPQVLCRGGQLTISAANSTLRSVLSALQVCIVETIALPDFAIEEKSWISLGPGPIREVMEQLLNSTDFNYVLDPSTADPNKMQSVLLMARGPDDQNKLDAGRAVASDSSDTPARAAWIAARNAARAANEWDRAQEGQPLAPAVSATLPAGIAPAPPPASANPEEVLADSGQNQAPAAPQIPSALPANTAASPLMPTADPDGKSAAQQAVQNKITDMQHLFEQRKKMTADDNARTAPPPAN